MRDTSSCRTDARIRKTYKRFSSISPSTDCLLTLDVTCWTPLPSTGSESVFICTSSISSLRQISMHLFNVKSLILRSFFVVCSFPIPSTMQSRIRLSRKQSQKLQVFAKVFNSTTKVLSIETIPFINLVDFANTASPSSPSSPSCS